MNASAQFLSLGRTDFVRLCALFLLSVLSIGAHPAVGQPNPVYVNDSPQAWEVFQRAEDQQEANVGEAVRLYQELLDDYALRLIPAFSTATDHYRSVRDRVNDAIAQDAGLLARYQLIATPQARRMLEAGQLQRLATTRMLTAPGLEALLLLAQRDLESAHFASAMQWLEEAIAHPQIDDAQAAYAWYMRGSAALYLQDARAVDEARGALERIGPAARRQLDRLNAMPWLNELPTRIGITPDVISTAGELSDLVPQPIWTFTLDQSLLRRRMLASSAEEEQISRWLNDRRIRGLEMTSMPVVQGDVVYVSEGHRTSAIDRFTGRLIWRRALTSAISMVDRDSSQVHDMNSIAVANGTLIVLEGHAQATERSHNGRVVCLDANTGSVRWLRDLDRIDGQEDFEGLFPYGAPLIIDGSVYLLARKVSRQNLTSVYVVCLDAYSGRLNWAQYLTSSGTVRRTPGRPFSTPVYRDGTLLVASPVGAVATMNARTGNINWLRRFNVPIAVSLQDTERRPWEIASAVWTERGVVATIPDQSRVVLLDRQTGDELESYPATRNDAWAGPRYLLANHHSVYAIGHEIRAFRHDDLQRPIWQLPEPRVTTMDEQGVEQIMGDDPVQINGRVQLTDTFLIVPTTEGIRIVDDETGRTRHTLEITPVGGNPLALDSQLLLADTDALHMFMSLSRAERMLRDRLAEQPNNPEAALALVQLGQRVGQLDLILEGGALAMQRTASMQESTAEEVRSSLFELLLTVDLEALDRISTHQDVPEDQLPSRRAQAFFDLMGQVASTHAQQIEHRFSWADWLVDHDLAAALEVYQSILTAPALASATRVEGDRMRTAADWARSRLRDILHTRGIGVYDQYASAAAEQLAALRAAPELDDEQLLALIAQYSFAPAAVDAATQVGELMIAQGQPMAASAVWMQTYRQNPTAYTATRLLGRYADLCEQMQRPRSALAAIEHVARHYPNVQLEVTDGAQRHVSAWRDRLLEAMPPRRAVEIGTVSGLAETSRGTVPERRDRIAGSREFGAATDTFLLTDEGALSCIDAESLEERWILRDLAVAPQVLRHTSHAIVLWSAADPDDPRAIALDPDSGERIWTTPRLSEFVGGDVVGDLQRGRTLREQLPSGLPFDPRQTLPLLKGERLIMVGRTGGLVGFHTADGHEPLWARSNPLSQVHLAVMNDNAIILAGLAGQQGQQQTAVITALDPDTGETLWQRPTLERNPYRWIVLTPMGRIICNNRNGIEAVDVLTGQSLWANVGYPAAEALRGWSVGDGVIFETQGALQSLDVTSGEVGEPFQGPERTDWTPHELQEVIPMQGEDLAFVRYSRRIVAFRNDGTLMGADAINEDREYRWLLPARDRIVVISGRAEQLLVADQDGRRTQFFYRIYVMSHNGRLLDRPQELPPLRRQVFHADLVQGRLLMSTADQTLVIPMPADM